MALRPANLPSEAVSLRTAAPLTGVYVDSPDRLIPTNAICVTFMFLLLHNAAAAENRVRARITWRNGDTEYSDELVIDGGSMVIVGDEAQIRTYFGAWEGPPVIAASPDPTIWDLSFNIPAGKQAVRVSVMEVGDAANPGTLEVKVAFK